MTGGTRKSAEKPRGRPFAPGNAGKPKGTRHKSTLAIEALLEGEAEKIGRKCVEKALEGDSAALRLAMERIAPVRRGRPVKFSMPTVTNAADVVAAIGAILGAIAAGELTPDEGQTVAQTLEVKRRCLELVELEGRISALEQAQEAKR